LVDRIYKDSTVLPHVAWNFWQNRLSGEVNSIAAILQQIMQVQPFNMKMLKEDMLHPLLQQMFKMTSLCTNTSQEISSPFVICLIDNCLLYSAAVWECCSCYFKFIKKVIWSGILSFWSKFFYQYVSSKTYECIDILKNKLIFFSHTLISVVCCRRLSWK